ncbi:MAG: nicotinate-nucleotide adenylyltransferase [Desulfovermiculus sp.]|nr:nicotinate-nucleotide adenylyltransferase [Desulfovermiculus sp.]
MSCAQTILSRNTGVIHGRFQVLHNDHLAYLLAGKAECGHLVVGITNPDPSLTARDDSDPERSDPRANPLSFYQRLLLVKCALVDADLAETDFSITPLPINFPEHYTIYVPMQATFFLTIYDEWGRHKLIFFQSLGLQTRVLWERTTETKGLSSSHIRQAMAAGQPLGASGPGKYGCPVQGLGTAGEAAGGRGKR